MSYRILHTSILFCFVVSVQFQVLANQHYLKESSRFYISQQVKTQNFEIEEGSTSGTFIDNIKLEDQKITAVSFILQQAEFLGISQFPKGDSEDDPEFDSMQVVKVDATSGEIKVDNPKYLLAVLSPLFLNVQITDSEGKQYDAEINITINDKEVAIFKEYELNWSRLADHPNELFEGAGGFVNSTFYTFGSFTRRFSPRPDVHGYNIDLNSWIPFKNMPPMADDSGSGGATHMGWTHDTNGNIYIAAGFAANASGTGQQFGSKRVYKYETSTDEYQELPSLPIDRSAGALHYVNNRLFYIAGTNKPRNTDQGDVLVLNLNDTEKGWEYRSPMPNPRHHSGSVLLNGMIYMLGGQKEHDGKLVPQDDVHRYDPETDTWSFVTDMPQAFNHIHASTFTYKDYIFTVGGQIEHNKGGYREVYAYQPSQNVWVQFSDLPVARYAMVADTFDDQIYAVGGNFSKNMYVASLPEAFINQTLSTLETTRSTITIYPNPVETVLSVDLTEQNQLGIKKISISDLQGKQITLPIELYKQNKAVDDRIYINLQDLASGMYILGITTKTDQLYYSKILKK
ncbi:T9SS type A sorting domain-containing protein [Aquimarina sp. ERC-38]|uniref:Kelch repeat-containing protein n=1 Tax=Aquimarina sp. ERC-38 TaxID=2949996 RepID=UPI0022478140|nr:kelch repeat-containing protein [Aquimarina sp. ERC-38]UZO81825.1 T9SS type A sorting domain-containing protein [Aquimarina sp. ERC-38]